MFGLPSRRVTPGFRAGPAGLAAEEVSEGDVPRVPVAALALRKGPQQELPPPPPPPPPPPKISPAGKVGGLGDRGGVMRPRGGV